MFSFLLDPLNTATAISAGNTIENNQQVQENNLLYKKTIGVALGESVYVSMWNSGKGGMKLTFKSQ